VGFFILHNLYRLLQNKTLNALYVALPFTVFKRRSPSSTIVRKYNGVEYALDFRIKLLLPRVLSRYGI